MHPRTIRSYVHRQRKLRHTKQQIVDALWPQYGVSYSPTPLDVVQLFGRDAPTTIEIGFGMGENLFTLAQTQPEHNFIGVEVHTPGVANLLGKMQQQPLSNIKIFHDDALKILANSIPDNSIDQFIVLFPDPWPKKRHHKRRLIQSSLVELLHRKLVTNGRLQIATDWQDYAEHVIQVMSHHPNFINLAGDKKFIPRPANRILTKFEQRGHKLGHKIWDMMFVKQST